jgi:hypothetical protein
MAELRQQALDTVENEVDFLRMKREKSGQNRVAARGGESHCASPFEARSARTSG